MCRAGGATAFPWKSGILAKQDMLVLGVPVSKEEHSRVWGRRDQAPGFPELPKSQSQPSVSSSGIQSPLQSCEASFSHL